MVSPTVAYGTLSYQWQIRDITNSGTATDIAGATSNSYDLVRGPVLALNGVAGNAYQVQLICKISSDFANTGLDVSTSVDINHGITIRLPSGVSTATLTATATTLDFKLVVAANANIPWTAQFQVSDDPEDARTWQNFGSEITGNGPSTSVTTPSMTTAIIRAIDGIDSNASSTLLRCFVTSDFDANDETSRNVTLSLT